VRKPRDYETELKALTDKARLLKERKVRQLGDLVIATGADALDPEVLTGALLAMAEVKDPAKAEAWRARGMGFFRHRGRKSEREDQGDDTGDQAISGASQSP
jgi:DNA-binding protein H-NS